MRHAKTKKMMDFWLELFWAGGNCPGSSAMPVWPDRSAVQPALFRELLSDMFILETPGGGMSYRLAGTNLCNIYGRELKRESYAEAFYGKDQRAAENWASRVGVDDYAALMCSTAETESGKIASLETLLLPLTHQGGTGRRVLGITSVMKDPVWVGIDPVISQTIRSVRVLRPWDKEKSLSAPIPFPSSRFSVDAPPLTSPEDHFLSDDEIKGGLNHYPEAERQVGHLTVFKGGRS